MKNKWIKSTIAYAMVASMVFGAVPVSVFAEESKTSTLDTVDTTNEDLEMWYQTPATDWETEALPIGNGYAGAQVFGGVKTEHFSLNDKTLWKGGPGIEKTTQWDYTYGNWSPTRPGNLQEARDLIEKDTYVSTSTIQNLLATRDNNQFLTMYGAYQPLGDLYLDMSHGDSGYTNYVRGLDLDTAVTTVKYTIDGVTYTRENFFSYPDNVMVSRITADQAEAVGFTMRMTTKLTGEYSFSAKEGKLTFRGTLPDNGMIYESQAQIVSDGGSVTNNGEKVSVSGANSVVIVYSSGTNYKFKYDPDITRSYRGEDPHDAITTRVENGVEKGYEALKKDHIADYSELYGRVSLDLGQQRPGITTDQVVATYKNSTATETDKRYLEVLAFNFGRFLLIESSREGSLPANLQGVWSPLTNPAWQSDYHVNINLQMNYWGVDVTNLGETIIPFNDFLQSMYEPGQITAKNLFESAGWTINNPINAFGYTGVQNYANGFWFPESTSWLLRTSYDHYLFSKDTTYLEKIYPLIKGQADFWMSYLISDKRDGTFVASPSLLPEQAPFAAGTSMAQQISNDIFQNFVEISTILDKDSDTRAAVVEKMKTLDKGLRIGKFGYVASWKDDANTMNPDAASSDFRHLNQAYALYPGNDISYEETPELMTAERKMLESRAASSQGWSRVWRTMLWSRVKDSKQSYGAYNGLLKNMTNANIFMMHPPFQIDANLGTPGAVAEMLMQSHLGYIDPIPSLPEEWKTGSFEGLVARGAFVMDMSWKDSMIETMKAVSKAGGNLDIMYNLDGATVEVEGTTVVPKRIENGAYRIPTEKGDVVTITMPTSKAPVEPKNLKAIRIDANKVELSWDASEDTTKYNIYKMNTKTAKLEKIAAEPTTTNYTDTTSDNGYYRVTAVNNNGESRLGISSGVQRSIAPTNVKAVRTTTNQVKLTWDAIDGVSSYNVYKANTNGEIVKLTTVTSNAYTHTTTENDVYYITALNNNMEVDYTRTNVTGGVKLTWNAVEGATEYEILNTNETVNVTNLGKVTATEYTHTGLSDSLRNRNGYSVRAIMKQATESTFSELTAVQLPNAPKYPLAVRSNPNTVKVTWTAATNATSYNIYKMNQAGVGVRVGSVDATSNATATTKEEYSHVTTENGIYRVAAVNEVGVESYMSVNAVVQLTATPEKVKAQRTSEDEVTITWKEVAGAEKYYIYERNEDGVSFSKMEGVEPTTNTYVHHTTTNGAYTVSAVAPSGVESEPSLVTAVSLSTDTSLSTLTYKIGDGSEIEVPGFASDVYTYNVLLPKGTTGTIILGGTTNHENATIAVTEGVIENNKATAKIVVTAEDGTTKKTYKVNFMITVDGETFLSDMEWTNIEVGYGNPSKDKNLKEGAITLHVDGADMVFAKGIGAHATSTISYDLATEGTTRFQSYVGVDAGQGTRGSVTFKVYADDVIIYTSKELTGASNAEYIDLDITGVKKLKLYADSGADNGNDHAMWAGAKLVQIQEVTEEPIDLIRRENAAVTVGLAEGETSAEAGETVGDANYVYNDPNSIIAEIKEENLTSMYYRFATGFIQKGSSHVGETSSIIVDLGETCSLTSTDIYFFSFASATKYKVYTSLDKEEWSEQANIDKTAESGTENRIDKVELEEPVNARYVKYTFTEAPSDKGPGYARLRYVKIMGNVPKPRYEVSFESGAQEVSGTSPESAEYEEGATFRLPANPYTREGYTFTGWNDGTKNYEPGATYIMPANTVIFTAQWEEVTTQEVIDLTRREDGNVKVYLADGEAPGEISETVNGVEHFFNNPSTVIGEMSQENIANVYYRFATDTVQKGSENVGRNSSIIVDLGAKCDINSTYIKFYSYALALDYTISASNDKKNWTTITSLDRTTADVTPDQADTYMLNDIVNARYVKYTFTEMHTTPAISFVRVKFITINGTVNNGTDPVPTTYAVTYEKGANDATGVAPVVDEYEAGTSIVLPSNPFTREGYTFKGWNDGTKTYEVGATYVMPAKEVTFTAQWEAKVIEVTSVSLDATTKTLVEGTNFTLKATVNPNNATNKVVTWETSNAAIATVTGGVVSAKTAGKVTITAKAGTKSATCEVTVTAKPVVVDKKALKDAIDNAKQYIEDEYTQESFAKLTKALADAQEVFKDSNATQIMVDKAKGDIETAIEQLIKKPIVKKYKVSYAKGALDVIGVEPSTAEYEEGTKVTLAENPFSRKGFEFVGWGDGVQIYKAGTIYTMLAGDTIFTAQWKEIIPPVIKNGWYEEEKGYRYYINNKIVTNKWVEDEKNNIWYYAGKDGYRVTKWNEIDHAWYYMDKDGTMLTGWQKIGNVWYYMNKSGKMQTGWQKINQQWYYMNESGKMQTGWQKINQQWYYMNKSGKMQTGWQKINQQWYYMNESGKMQTGWQKINQQWYYMNESGKMQTGWQKINQKWYYMNESGKMQTGWQKINQQWYYMNQSGKMQTGWHKVNNKWYYMNKSGKMLTGWQKDKNKWYYLQSNGAMKTGWVKLKGVWYFLKANGEMGTGWTFDGKKTYYLNRTTGAWDGRVR